MDINDMRIAVTVISLLLFIALVAYTWSRRRNAEYASAALLPFADEVDSKAGANANPNANANLNANANTNAKKTGLQGEKE